MNARQANKCENSGASASVQLQATTCSTGMHNALLFQQKVIILSTKLREIPEKNSGIPEKRQKSKILQLSFWFDIAIRIRESLRRLRLATLNACITISIPCMQKFRGLCRRGWSGKIASLTHQSLCIFLSFFHHAHRSHFLTRPHAQYINMGLSRQGNAFWGLKNEI